MPRLQKDTAREHRIEMEIVVDAYNNEERAMSWYCYLEEGLKFPFKARCKSMREISPLRFGEEVDVVGIAPEDECASEMFVRIRRHAAKFAVPLSQLEPINADRKTKACIADWHYWVGMGYEF